MISSLEEGPPFFPHFFFVNNLSGFPPILLSSPFLSFFWGTRLCSQCSFFFCLPCSFTNPLVICFSFYYGSPFFSCSVFFLMFFAAEMRVDSTLHASAFRTFHVHLLSPFRFFPVRQLLFFPAQFFESSAFPLHSHSSRESWPLNRSLSLEIAFPPSPVFVTAFLLPVFSAFSLLSFCV